jgi:signal transduction histidine kinase
VSKNSLKHDDRSEKYPLNLAIVGGGKACQFFLELLGSESFDYFNIVGVCDINPDAEGFRLAKEKGFHTTDNYKDLFKIEGLDVIIEITGSRDVLLELIRLKPKGVGVLEHNIGGILKRLSSLDQRLKFAEQQVAFEKRTSDFLIQQANERIVVLKPDFSIIDANEPYLEAVGKSKEEVIGAHCYEVTHGLTTPCSSFQSELGCPLVETLRTGESAQVIHEHPSPDDKRTYCDMVTYPLKDQNGEVIRVIEIWRDITAELSSRWESRIEAMKDDLKKIVQEDRMISLGKLVASSVHEINNPIQGLMNFSHLMLDILEERKPNAEDLEKFKKYLSLMSGELERCGNIISGLLSFSRQSESIYRDVDLNEILEQVIELTRHKMEIQDIRLDTRLSASPLIVDGDVNQLQQCFLNLIFNAIEAMAEGGELKIESESDKTRKSALIEFRDTGCGIADSNLGHIFDPFFTTKEEGQGTGMGLSIVYGIVRNHGGDIKVDSDMGKGSTFSLSFPIHNL